MIRTERIPFIQEVGTIGLGSQGSNKVQATDRGAVVSAHAPLPPLSLLTGFAQPCSARRHTHTQAGSADGTPTVRSAATHSCTQVAAWPVLLATTLISGNL